MLSKYTFTLFTLLICKILIAQEHNIRHLGVKDGLLHSKVTCTFTDSVGYMWIGTQAGLQRYDGNSFKTYLIKEPEDYIRNPNIILYMKARGKYLYLGTMTGFQCFDMQAEQFIDINSQNIKDVIILSIDFEQDGTIWLGGYRALYSVNHNEKSNLFTFNDIQELNYRIQQLECKISFLKFSSEKMFLGANNGLFVFQKSSFGQWVPVPTDFNLCEKITRPHSKRVKDFHVNDSNIIILSPTHIYVFSINHTNNGINALLKSNIWLLRFFSNEFRKQNVGNLTKRLFVDKNNTIWVSTWNGLYVIKNVFGKNPEAKVFLSSYNGASISSSNTEFISSDNRGNLIVTTENAGINIIDPEPRPINKIESNPYNSQNSLNHMDVTSIDIDKEDNIWVGLQSGGVNVFNSKHNKIGDIYSREFNQDTLFNKYINCVKCVGDTILVVNRAGIDIIDRNSYKVKRVITELPDTYFGSLKFVDIDNNKNLWVGSTRNGLFKIKPPYENKQYIHLDDSIKKKFHLTANTIRCMFYDREYNELFVGTEIGLTHFTLSEDGNLKSLNKITPIDYTLKQENLIWDIAKCNDSIYYLSSYYGIIFKLTVNRASGQSKLEKLKRYNLSNCEINYIETIICDANENIWTSGNRIFKILNDENLGCPNVQPLVPFMATSSARNSSGKLYFAGSDEIIYFHPDKLNKNTLEPNVKITSAYLISPVKEERDNIVLSELNTQTKSGVTILKHDQNDVRIEFSAFYYLNPEACLYTYSLEGYNRYVKSITVNKPYAEYIDLPPGNYKFSVHSELISGSKSKYPDSIRFSVKPPWWFSKLAFTGYTLITLGLIYLSFVYSRRWIAMKNNIAVKEQVHQAKLRFFTNISHEFRTPLTLIIDPLDKLIKNKYARSQVEQYIPLVRKNANALLELVNEIMEFRKVETGNLKIWAEETNMLTFLETLIEPFKQKTENTNIKLNIIKNEEECIAWIDRQKFKKIINNLLSNALKFTNTSVTIRVSPTKISFPNHLKNSLLISNNQHFSDFIEIAVEDDGIGLEQNVLSSIFDRYYQEQSLNNIGTGIGLAYTKQLILLHEGELLVESEKNKGTRFIIRIRKDNTHIPKDQLEESNKNIRAEQIEVKEDDNASVKVISDITDLSKSKKETILIVEDNEDIRNYLYENFMSEYEVKLAKNGKEGVEQANEYLPDLIITDVMMPVMDGIELCKLLKTDVQTSHIPIIMLTAKTSAANTIEGLETGADKYLPKPFDIEVLSAHIKNLIQNRALLHEKFQNNANLDLLNLNITTTDKSFFEKLVDIISENIEKSGFNVDRLCEIVGMSRRNLQRKLKSATGMTPLEFIRTVRLNHAARLIYETELNINEIADNTGFSSTEHFRKSFKEKFGVAPTQYKASKGV